MASKTDMTGTTLPSAAAPMAVPAPPLAQAELQPREPLQGQATTSGRGIRKFFDDVRVPSFLVSTIIHTLLLLILALLVRSGGGNGGPFITATQGNASSVVSLQAIDPDQDSPQISPIPADQPVVSSVVRLESQAVAPPLTDLGEVVDTEFSSKDLPKFGATSATSTAPLRLPGGGLAGRTPHRRKELGDKYGASAESEAAVEAALRWLADHQRGDGSWSFDLALEPCNGRCRNSKKQTGSPATPTPSTGATGLALLAFLGAGHTHHDDGPYSETVRQGIYYLRAASRDSEFGLEWQQGSMYGHGIALMALSEALSMTTEDQRNASDLVDLVRGGVSFTSLAQHKSGSWGYVPGSPGDTTVTGWQVLSLIAAKRSQIYPHSNVLRDARKFILSTSEANKFWFGYQGPPGEETTTAIALTLLLYLGESPDYSPFYNAFTAMAKRGPKLNNIYHDYYATLALHHTRHHLWDQWNQKLRDHLIASQEDSGHEAGSWHFKDRWGDVGGRLYTTAMCAMTLEVYYRYLPLYGEIDDFPL